MAATASATSAGPSTVDKPPSRTSGSSHWIAKKAPRVLKDAVQVRGHRSGTLPR